MQKANPVVMIWMLFILAIEFINQLIRLRKASHCATEENVLGVMQIDNVHSYVSLFRHSVYYFLDPLT